MICFLKSNIRPEIQSILVLADHPETIAIPSAKGVDFVIAVEARSKTFYLLEKSVDLNSVIKNLSCWSIACQIKRERGCFLGKLITKGESKITSFKKLHKHFYGLPIESKLTSVQIGQILTRTDCQNAILEIKGGELEPTEGTKSLQASLKNMVLVFAPYHISEVFCFRFVERWRKVSSVFVAAKKLPKMHSVSCLDYAEQVLA